MTTLAFINPNVLGLLMVLGFICVTWWEGKTAREITKFQLFTAEMCMPFPEFHKALEESLGRPVFTHELALNFDGIALEFLGEADAPTMQEIIDLLPESKRIIIITPPQENREGEEWKEV